ncbi:MAG TPA: hypothetical protein VFO69_03680, partial [Allosphingosinicella sp.]|nr:hypothetical protein [Allosphingosinicella sp.]
NHDDPEILTAALNTIRLQQTVTDADGDTDTATVDLSTGVFRFEDDGPSFVAGTVTSAVGEDTLPDGLIDAGDTKTTSTGAISLAGLVDFGTDGAGSLRFDASAIAALTAQNISSNGVLLKYAVSADGLTLTAYTGASAGTGTDVFTVTLSGTDATFVLLDQIDHTGANLSGSGDDQIKTIDLSGVIRIYDADGDSVALGANAFRVTVEDDIPDVTQASNINIQNSGDVAHTGIFVAKSGADNPSVTNDLFKSVTFSAVVNSTTVQTTTPLTQVSEDADKAVFSFSFSYNSGSGSTLATGTITFYKTDANGATPGTYTVDLDNPIAGLSIQSVQGGQAPVFHDLDLNGDGDTTDNGEDNLVAVVQVGSDFFIQFTGRTGVNAPTSDFGHDDLWGGGTRAEVKISSSAIGVFGNSVQDKDVLDYNFYSSDPGATLGAPTTSAGTAFVKITQFNPNGGEDFVITLKLADPATPGTFITRTIVVNSNDVLTTAPAGYPALSNGEGYIIIEPNDYIYLPAVPDNYEIVGIQLRSSTEGVQSTTGEVYNFNGNLGAFDSTTAVFGPTGGGDQGTNDNDVFKIIDIGVVRTSTVNQTATLTFNVTIGDADGDTDTQTVVATINSSPDSSTPIPVTPVVLDMDGDGVAFLPLAAGVMFNYGAGWVSTAWAGPNDAILLRDVNGNGLVDDASEFVFGGNGLTDMEALHAMYGEQLDASDADFTMFALWTDANSNGVVDSGEMQSLAEAGIVSIGLVSDGQSYVAANGDVFVAGSSTYTRTDGSTGEAADAAFATGLVARTQEVERIAANSNTTVLAAAVAAAGMAASSAAAAGTGTDSADSAMRTALYAIESVSMPDLSGSTSAQALATAIQDASATIAFPLGGATFDGPQWTGLIGDLGQVGGFDAAPSPFGQGTEMLAVQIALPSVMSDVGMPSAAQMATIDRGPVQTIDTVEMILVDALEGGGVNPIDTVLNGFVPEIGGIAVIDGAASGFQAGVSTWDMGSAGIFTPAVTNVITNEAMMLHHDAIQPAANG